MRLVVGLAIVVLGYAPAASAQPAGWVFVPTSTTDEIAWMEPTAEAVGAALSEQGAPMSSPEQTLTLFAERGSGPPAKVTGTQIERLDALMKEALRLIVTQEHAKALEVLGSAQRLIDEAIAELNRTKSQAQNVLDTCLYMVRALHDAGEQMRATAQARQCVRLVPEGKANPRKHPPEIIMLYEDATQPGPEKTGSLAVDSRPQGCDARINGLRLGQTPFTITDLYPGDYQVQVECDPGQRGRVHQASVGNEQTRVFVDVELDRAVRTEPLLNLNYVDEPEVARQLRDGRTIVEALRVEAVVLASLTEPDVLELQVVRSGEFPSAPVVRIPTSPNGPSTESAMQAALALVNDECVDFTGPRPRAIPCRGEVPHPGRPPKGQWISGLTLVSAGGASLVASYALLIWRRDTGNVVVAQVQADPSITTNQQKWLRLGDGVIITAATGGALTVAAMPLVLPYRSKTPWWAWLSGGLGVGLAVGSIVSGATAESAPAGNRKCEDPLSSVGEAQACVDRGRSVDRAIVLGATAAPLLTIPLVYLLRRDDKKLGVSVTPSVAFGQNGGAFSVRGRF